MSTGRSRFRAFYKEFVIVPIEESFRPLLEGFPGYQGAPYALVYGYVDPARGFMVEVVACAEKGGGDFRFRNSTHKKRSTFKVSLMAGKDFYFMRDPIIRKDLARRYKKKTDVLKAYEVAPPLEATRQMEILDTWRDEDYPDRILVTLLIRDPGPKDVWVQLKGIYGDDFRGQLMKHPGKGYGLKKGDEISFSYVPMENGLGSCMAFLDQDMEEGLDLPILKDQFEKALASFQEGRTKSGDIFDMLMAATQLDFWVPFYRLQDQEKKALLQSLLGTKQSNIISFEEVARLKEMEWFPAFVGDQDRELFLPLLTDKSQAPDIEAEVTLEEMSFAEAVTLASSFFSPIEGLAVNPDSTPFLIPLDLAEMVLDLPEE